MAASRHPFRNTTAIVCSLLAAVLAAGYHACRVGYSDAAVGPVLRTLGLSWLLLHFPFGVQCLVRPVRDSSSWLASDGALTLVGLLAVLLLALAGGTAAALPLAACGGVLCLARTVSWMRGEGLYRAAGAIFFALLLGASLVSRSWGERCHDPLIARTIPQGGGHHDELFHYSISNMFRTYGIASTGLDGLPYLPYHTGSHFLLAQFGFFLHQTAIDVYNLTFPVVFIPLLFQSVFLAGLALARANGPVQPGFALLIGLAVVSVSTGVVPGALWRQAGTWQSCLGSESMCVALVTLLLGLAAAGPLLWRPEDVVRPGRPVAALVACFAFPAFVGVLGFLKLSVAAVALPTWVVLYLTSGALRRSWLIGASTLAAAAVFLVTYRLTCSPGYKDEMAVFIPFAFIRTYIAREWWGYYLLLQFLLLLPAVGLRLHLQGVHSLGELAAALRAGGLRDVLLAVLFAVIGTVPGMMWSIDGGSAAYFSEIQHWVALAVLIPGLLDASARTEAAPLSWREWLLRLPVWRLAFGFVVLSVFATMLLNTSGQVRELVRINLDDRGFGPSPWAGPEAVARRPQLSGALRRGRLVSAYRMLREQAALVEARKDAPTRMIQALQDLYWMPLDEKRVSFLYVPKTNRTFWDLFGTARPGWDVPLVAPAVSGLALIDGLPERKDCTSRAYGYIVYPLPPEGPRLRAEEAREAVCRKAAALGMRRVIVLDCDRDGQPLLYEWPTERSGQLGRVWQEENKVTGDRGDEPRGERVDRQLLVGTPQGFGR